MPFEVEPKKDGPANGTTGCVPTSPGAGCRQNPLWAGNLSALENLAVSNAEAGLHPPDGCQSFLLLMLLLLLPRTTMCIEEADFRDVECAAGMVARCAGSEHKSRRSCCC